MQPIYLACLPFAGAGASFFRGWQRDVPDELTILPVQLPGREERFTEPPHTDAVRAADEACSQLLGTGSSVTRMALFGHSLGAVLAYEVAKRLDEGTGIRLERLFVSGSPAPWNGRSRRASGLRDAEFLAEVHEFSGYAHPALQDPEMQSLLLPTIRADVEMHENYQPGSERPLNVPITALRGRADRLVDRSQLDQWKCATTAQFSVAELDGGHMYLAENPTGLLELITAELTYQDGC